MPWKEASVTDQRLSFVGLAKQVIYPMGDLCEQFGISRKTGYKWLNRYEACGKSGLVDQRTMPNNRTSDFITDLILAEKRHRRYWGSDKLKPYLEKLYPEVNFPSARTIGKILKSHGLTKLRVQRTILRRPSHLRNACSPNEVWAIDFKGDFKSRCGTRCYPLTVSDHFSRYLLCCNGQTNTSSDQTKRNLTRTFKEYGLPEIIRSDNGVPFVGCNGLTDLSVWWIKLGIKPEIIDPGKPHQNGRHERIHRTLKLECIKPGSRSFATQKKHLGLFRKSYNYDRPHQALNSKTPGEIYYPSKKEYKNPVDYEYPKHFETTVVQKGGMVHFKRKRWFITHTLGHEEIGLEPIEDGSWQVYFRFYPLGILHENGVTFKGYYGR